MTVIERVLAYLFILESRNGIIVNILTYGSILKSARLLCEV
jgi:hypothetical protein